MITRGLGTGTLLTRGFPSFLGELVRIIHRFMSPIDRIIQIVSRI